MNYTQIRLPKTEQGSRAFAVLAKQHRLVGVRERGEIVYHVPTPALDALEKLGLPYEKLSSGPISPAEFPGTR